MFGSVRARLMVWNVAIVALLTIVLGLAVSWRTRGELMAGIDRDLRDRAARNMGLPGWGPGQVPGPPPFGGGPGGGFQRRNAGVSPPPGAQPRTPGGPPADSGPGASGNGPEPGYPIRTFDPNLVFVAQGAFRPRVFDLRGQSITQFAEDSPWDQSALAKAAITDAPVLTDAIWQGEEHRVLTHRRRREQGEFLVQYATPLAETKRAIAGINQILIAMLPLALFVAGLGGYWLTERALRPVGRIAALAERISGENLAERLPVSGRDEFAQLASTINLSLDRLEVAFRALSEAMERQKRFTADASHELKTPLTAIKAQTSLALSTDRGAADYRDALAAVDRSADRMSNLIDDLLFLARGEAAKPCPESTELGPLVLEVAAEAIPAAGPQVTLALDPKAKAVRATPTALRRILLNLLSNATRHSPTDGSIVVASQRVGEETWIEIRDSGEGIAAEHLPHLGERFYRVDSARSRAAGGVGLGLSICRSLIEAEGGRLEIESEVGRGTTVRLRFPNPSHP